MGFIRKEFFHIFRDPRTLLIIMGIPISQLLLFGFVITTEVKDVKLAVYDPSKDDVSARLVQKLTSTGYFELVENLESDQNIGDIFKKGKVKEVLVFENDFGRKLQRGGEARLQLLADASDPNVARIVSAYTQGIIRDFIRDQQMLPNLPVKITPEVRMYYNEEARSVFLFVPGLMALIMMLVSAIMSSLSITREKELGTLEVLLVSPLRPIHIVLGKVVPYLLLSFVDALIIVAMANWVFLMPVHGSLVLLLAECFLFIFLSLSLGVLISTVAPTQLIAMFMAMIGLMLPTLLLSGFIFPVENMPKILQWFSVLMPARWFNDIVKDIMLKGNGLFYLWDETLILLAMSLFFVVLSVRNLKNRLE